MGNDNADMARYYDGIELSNQRKEIAQLKRKLAARDDIIADLRSTIQSKDALLAQLRQRIEEYMTTTKGPAV